MTVRVLDKQAPIKQCYGVTAQAGRMACASESAIAIDTGPQNEAAQTTSELRRQFSRTAIGRRRPGGGWLIREVAGERNHECKTDRQHGADFGEA